MYYYSARCVLERRYFGADQTGLLLCRRLQASSPAWHQQQNFRSLPRICAKPSRTGPEKTVQIYCSKCLTFLYKYRKAGKGSLVKAFHERIVEDATNGDLKCPECGIEFARPAVIKGLPANKFIGGKVNMQK